MHPARRWLALLSAAIAAVLTVVLPLSTASAASAPAAGTRVGASHPETILLVGPSRLVSAGEGRGEAVPQAQIVAGGCVAAEDATGSLTGSALARSGVSAEQRVSQAIGAARNVGPGRVTIPGSGPGGFRVPDFSPAQTIAARGSVVEVKDAAQLSVTPQLRDMVAYAQGQGVPLEIFTNANLPSSGELFNWIQSGQVVISPIP